MSKVIDFCEYRAMKQREKARHVQGTVAAFSKVAFGSEVLDRDFDDDESFYADAIRAVAFQVE